MSALVLIRHGETVGQCSLYLYGSTYVELDYLGREQLRRAAEAARPAPCDRILTSPLVRARAGAAMVAEGRAIEPLVVEDFREVDFGQWEGWTLREVMERDPERYRAYRKGDADFAYPGGDTRSGFRARVARGVAEHLADPDGRAGTICVLHKGVIKAILATLLGLTWDEARVAPVEFGSIWRLEWVEGHWRVRAANDTTHLGETRVAASR